MFQAPCVADAGFFSHTFFKDLSVATFFFRITDNKKRFFFWFSLSYRQIAFVSVPPGLPERCSFGCPPARTPASFKASAAVSLRTKQPPPPINKWLKDEAISPADLEVQSCELSSALNGTLLMEVGASAGVLLLTSPHYRSLIGWMDGGGVGGRSQSRSA